jgi:hypothetical protein
MRAELYLRKRHGEIVIPNKQDASVGLRTHLADANPQRFGDAVTGIRLHLADTSNGLNYSDADKGLKLHLAEAQADARDIISAMEILNK